MKKEKRYKIVYRENPSEHSHHPWLGELDELKTNDLTHAYKQLSALIVELDFNYGVLVIHDTKLGKDLDCTPKNDELDIHVAHALVRWELMQDMKEHILGRLIPDDCEGDNE